jgi:hypothetical protein
VLNLTDDAFCLDRARDWAARRYRAAGYQDFAKRVEKGLEDDCSQVRLGRFFFEPTETSAPALILAKNELASLSTNLAG